MPAGCFARGYCPVAGGEYKGYNEKKQKGSHGLLI
jgi:hypothetical protein